MQTEENHDQTPTPRPQQDDTDLIFLLQDFVADESNSRVMRSKAVDLIGYCHKRGLALLKQRIKD